MKIINVVLYLFMLSLILSCAKTTKFPVSSITPAATITAKKKKDKNGNFVLSITAINLASPERLSPPKKVYVLWIITKDKSLKNLGQLKNENAEKSSLETLSVFEPVEILITAEEEGNVMIPKGIEISRAHF